MDMSSQDQYTRTLLFLVFSCIASIVLLAYPYQTVAAAVQLTEVKAAMQIVELTGYTRARNSLPLSAEADGRVKHVYADVGQVIAEDGRVACMDTAFIDLDIETNKTDQLRLKADLEYFSRQVKRYKRLVREKSSAQSQLDDFVRQQSSSRQRLAALEIDARRLAEKLSRHCIVAPAGWQLTERAIEPGQWVRSGQQVGMAGNYRKLLVPFSLTVAELAALQRDADSLQVYLPDSQLTVSATIERISPAYDPATRKRHVDLLVEQAASINSGGVRVLLRLSLSDRSGAVMVPASTLTEKYEQFWLTREDGREVRVVYLGKVVNADDKRQWVRIQSSELEPGDRVRLR